MRPLRAFFAGILPLPASGQAQSVSVAGIFPTVDHSGTLTDKLEYSLYYFAAVPLVNFDPDATNDAYFHLFYSEQALTVKATDQLSFTGSYVYQRANPVAADFVNENRFHVQAKYKQPFPKLTLTHRLRFDGRFIQDRVTRTSPFTHRVRYLVGLERSLNAKNYLATCEELFFNTHHNASPSYGENWFYAAFGRNLNTGNKLEAGLLYVTWNIGNRNWFNQYYLQFTWINHIDLRKKTPRP